MKNKLFENNQQTPASKKFTNDFKQLVNEFVLAGCNKFDSSAEVTHVLSNELYMICANYRMDQLCNDVQINV